ncbi:MAG: trehalase family glycosidase [Clostridia bacterium]|nr:trehalase family glycosidase [Clostridia bacterium]
MQPLEYDIRHFPFSRYGAMVAVSRDLQKNELVFHDARAHDGQDRALRVIFSDRPIVPKDDEDLKEIPGIPFQSTGTPSRLFITAASGKAEIIISGDHRLRVQAEGLFLLLTPCRKDGSTAVMIDQKHVESICPSASRYARIDMEKGSMSLFGETTLRGGQYPAKRMTSVLIAPEDGVIDFQVQLAQSPALVDETIPAEESCRRAEEDWAAFLQKMPPVPEKYREYGEKAWFALWAAYVKAQPPYHDDTILMSKKFMSAVWSWDHCFNALAVGRNDPALGMNQLLCPFYLQQEDGALPDRFGPDSVLWACSKPPVHGWCRTKLRAWHEYDEQTLRTVYRHLEKWTDWWMTCRVYGPDSLPGYPRGCDSGLDNSTCFDKGDYIESADLSAYLALQMNCLSDIARKLNEPEAAAQWKQKSAALIDKMIARLWNGTRFVPRLCRTQEAIGDTESILLYLPLVLGDLLPAEIADKMIEEMKKHNLTAYGLASESPESPKYNPDGYWRGPIWAPTTYLIVDGLKRMGRTEDAKEIALRFCGMCTEKAHGFYENYDALTGIGLRTPGYTWTASAFLCMVWEFCM